MRGGPELDMDDRPVQAPTFGRRSAPPVATGFPRVFEVPVEMCLYQANGVGQVTLRRWRQLGAEFKAVSRVWRVEGRLVAEIAFRTPIGPEKAQAAIVQLTTHLWESLA